MRLVERIPFRHVLIPAVFTAVFVLPSFFVHLRSPSAADPVRATALCLDCHSGIDSTLVGSAHQLPAGGADRPEDRIACTDCHGGDSRHWEEDPEQFPMTNPAEVGAAAEARLCSGCHQTSHQQNMAEKNVHPANGVSCSGCHGVHASGGPTLLIKAEPGLCIGCHPAAEGQFARPYRHPVADGVVRCSECHRTLDETRRELSLSGTNMCVNCHAEFEGPFPFEHQATVDYSTEEGGCLTCHSPHGSSFPRMLHQPYEPPHYQLCTQCHSVPGHNSNPMHGTQWSGVACNDCHTDIHGSYTSRFFLSEALEGEGCFNSGCHQF